MPSPTPYAFTSGAGTIASPYALETRTDVEHINDHPSSYFKMTQDIDMSGGSFAPLNAFSGVLYGFNHHLYNLVITKTDGTTAALFSSVSGTVTQVYIQGAVISSNGYAAGIAGSVTGMLSGCTVSGTITSGLGGNGFNTGTGNGAYVTKSAGASIVNIVESLVFNGNHVTTTLN